jgi:hypothetical protein
LDLQFRSEIQQSISVQQSAICISVSQKWVKVETWIVRISCITPSWLFSLIVLTWGVSSWMC